MRERIRSVSADELKHTLIKVWKWECKMAKIEHQRNKYRSDGAIGIELNEQEELILKANNSDCLLGKLFHIIWRNYRSTRCKQWNCYKQYISKTKDLNSIQVKAQEMKHWQSILHINMQLI